MFDEIQKCQNGLNQEQINRLYNSLENLNVSEENKRRIIKILDTSLNTYSKHPDNWDTILKIRDDLPGTKEEKAIFMIGYMFHSFMDEYQESLKGGY